MALNLLLNLIFPPQCLTCETLVPEHGTLCLPCWQQVRFVSEPMCECCGLPFEFEAAGAMCADCLHTRPPYAKARAALHYDDASSRMVTQLKYADQTQLAEIYGTWLAKAGREVMNGGELLVPVPLHWKRFISRRYNQSALLAQSLAKRTGMECLPDALTRTRHTTPQTGLSRSARLDNVKNAFALHKHHANKIKGREIVLIDDVLTTGSTIAQCTKALLNGGARQVVVLTLARAIR